MMVVCNVSDIVEYGRRRPGLSNVPIVTEHDNNQQSNIPLNIQPSYSPPIHVPDSEPLEVIYIHSTLISTIATNS